MLALKNGVKVDGLQPETLLGILTALLVFAEHGADCIITGGKDGVHSTTSLHYSGNAIDFRTRHISKATTLAIVKTLNKRLGVAFDVIFEGNHIHMEYQPKGPRG